MSTYQAIQRLAIVAVVVLAIWHLFGLFAPILAPFVAAAVIAYMLDPAATRLTRLGLSRDVAAAIMIVAVVAGIFLFALLLYPLVGQQIDLLVRRIPRYALLAQSWARELLTQMQERFGDELVNDKIRDFASGQAGSMLSIALSTVTGLIGSGFAIFNLLSLIVVTPVAGFYLLRDWRHVIATIDSWLPRRYAETIQAQAREVDRILSAWVRGQALCCLSLATYYAVGLTLAGLDLGLIVGLATGLTSFIPYVGSVLGGATAIGLAFAQFPTWYGVAGVAGVLVLGQLLEGYVIYPRVLGDRVELPAIWVIFALMAGGAAYGFLGVMMAVPVAATIGVLSRFWLRRYLDSSLYSDPA